MQDLLLLLAGVFCAGVGGELFVRGTISISDKMRVPRGVVAATVAAFATSAPELSVSIASALNDNPALGVGDALGSNVTNIALVASIALLLGASIHNEQSSKRYVSTALYAPLVTAGLIYDGVLSRLDASLLISIFLVWLVLTVRDVRRDESTIGLSELPAPLWKAVFNLSGGLPLLVFAGLLVVRGATGIAQSFGFQDFVIGATIVAIGTSIPEVAVVVIARFKNLDDVGLGTLIGSNIFNGIAIVPIATLIRPLEVDAISVLIALFFGFMSVLIIALPPASLRPRVRGMILLSLYILHLLLVSTVVS